MPSSARLSRLKVWIEAMRLRTLPVSVAGVIMAVGISLACSTFHWLPALLCLLFAVLCQVASNFANEYFDFRSGADKPGRVGPRRGVTEGDITPQAMLSATLVTLGVACCIGLCIAWLGGWWLIAVGVAVALGVIAYSAGPYPLSRHGLGEVAVVVFFGIVPVNFTYYLLSGGWSWPTFAASLAVGLLGANVIIVNNYRDRDDDRDAGKRTLAVRLGLPFMRGLYTVNGIVAAVLFVPAWLIIKPLLAVLCIIPAVAACLGARALDRRTGAALNPMLGITALVLLAYVTLYLLVALVAG